MIPNYNTLTRQNQSNDMTGANGKEKRVQFGGLDKPYPFPIATPPDSPPDASIRLFAKQRPGALCNEMSAKVRLSRRRARRAALEKKTESWMVEDEEEATSSQGS